MNPDSKLSAQLLLETCQFSDLNRHFLCCGRGKRKKKRLSGGLHAVTCLLSWDNKAGRSNLLPSCMAGLYHSPTCPVSYFWMRVPPLHSLPGALAWPSLASPCRNLDFLTAWLSQSTHCPFLALLYAVYLKQPLLWPGAGWKALPACGREYLRLCLYKIKTFSSVQHLLFLHCLTSSACEATAAEGILKNSSTSAAYIVQFPSCLWK